MHAELTSTRTETTRRYDLTDAPPTPVTARLLMVPLEAVVRFVDGHFDSLRLYGRVIRDDHLPGEPVTYTYFAEETPEWARPLIEETPSDQIVP